MADKIQTLLVSLEARINQYQSQMAKALATTNSTTRKVESRFAAMNKSVTANFGALAAGFVGAAAIRGAQQLIDASTRIENSLKVAGLAGEQLTRVYDNLFVSAQKNAAPLEALVDLYGRASLVQKELGVTTKELLGFTDKVAVALRVSGKSAAESSGALLQLSQALGSGVVRAEEFNSILEGALPVAQAAAAGLREAGGSVAKLRSLVVDGKVSSEAFFRAFEAGSAMLVDKVANAELTVSQGFIRLQNVLIDTAGKFDDATGTSDAVGGALNELAIAVQNVGTYMENNKGRIGGFFDALGKGFDDLEQWKEDFREAVGLSGPGGLDDFLEGTSLIEGTFGFASDAARKAVPDINAAKEAMVDFIDTLSYNSASGMSLVTPEQIAQLQGLTDELVAGTITAEEATAALQAIETADPDMAGITQTLIGLAGTLDTVKQKALATSDAVRLFREADAKSMGLLPTPKGEVVPVSLNDYETPAGTGGKKKSPAQKLEDELAAQRRKNESLREETALRATLNPLVNDYGYAVERLRVQQELENAATAAGLELTPDRKKAIAELAEGYGAATVEAEKLTEAQDKAAESMADWFALGRDAARGFIDDLVEGKSAAEALGNVFNQLGNKLIDMGLGAIFGTGKGDFGAIGDLLGFASGTANTGGARGQPRGIVHGQEAVIPLPNGGRVPVDIRMPTPMGGNGGGMTIDARTTIHAPNADAAGLARLEALVRQRDAELPARIKQVVVTRGKKWI